jgi:hypothetical protein
VISGDRARHDALADLLSGHTSGQKKGQGKNRWHTRASGKCSRCFARGGGKKAGTVNGVPAPVVKASKECSPAMADVAAPAKVVAAPAPVTKAPGSFHPTGVVVEIVGTEVGDRGRSCEEHLNNCGKVLAKDVVVRFCKVQIQVEGGQEETAIAAYWVTDGVDRCHVGCLPRHMVKQAGRYNGALAQVTSVFDADTTCCDTAECAFHKNRGCFRAAIITC